MPEVPVPNSSPGDQCRDPAVSFVDARGFERHAREHLVRSWRSRINARAPPLRDAPLAALLLAQAQSPPAMCPLSPSPAHRRGPISAASARRETVRRTLDTWARKTATQHARAECRNAGALQGAGSDAPRFDLQSAARRGRKE
jgi:hypothetical protein